jgi:hypothetical protein
MTRAVSPPLLLPAYVGHWPECCELPLDFREKCRQACLKGRVFPSLICQKCNRRWQDRVDRLLERYGADIAMPDLRHELAQRPRRRVMSIPVSSSTLIDCGSLALDAGPADCDVRPED